MRLSSSPRPIAGTLVMSVAMVCLPPLVAQETPDWTIVAARRQAARLRQREGQDLPVFLRTGPRTPEVTSSGKARSRHFSKPGDVPLWSLPLPKSRQVSIPVIVERFATPEALPTQASDVVVQGVVTAARATLTDDETAIYSEFEIRVDRVLKSDGTVSVGQTITALRFGGVLQLPDARISVRDSDETMPLVDGAYVLFLKRHSPEDPAFLVTTGYRTDGPSVEALDLHTPALSLESKGPAQVVEMIAAAVAR